MMISDEIADHLTKMLICTSLSAIKAIYEYKSKRTYIPTYYNFPRRFLKGLEDSKEYDEFKEKIPAFKYGIPFYTTTGFKNPYNYGELLSVSDGQFSINCHTLDGFEELLATIQNDPGVMSRFTDTEDYLQSTLVSLVGNIANRYFYVTGKLDDASVDEEIVKELVFEQCNRLFLDNLQVKICVPICFLEFETDDFKITDDISICRMSDDYQISRYNASHFESTPESNIAQCANFMICLEGYFIKNEDSASVRNAAKNSWAYPTGVIDDLFAAIRIATGAKTGYGQMLIEPKNWADKWTGSLLPLYGTNIIAFNRNEVKTVFFGYDITKINVSEIQLTRDIFNELQSNRAKRKNDSFSKVFIAIQRLNRCMLREADDDTALDAIIGIEALLSGDTQGEITYTISNRMAVVAARIKECPLSASDARKAMKKIYGLRSDIVHGRETKKNSTLLLDGKELSTKELAVDFLRYSLLFIIQNQGYLDVKEFEESLDDALSG